MRRSRLVPPATVGLPRFGVPRIDRKSTRLNSSHGYISYAVFCLKKKKANLIKQQLPARNGGSMAGQNGAGECYGKSSKVVYETLTHHNQIELVRSQRSDCHEGPL